MMVVIEVFLQGLKMISGPFRTIVASMICFRVFFVIASASSCFVKSTSILQNVQCLCKISDKGTQPLFFRQS